MQSFEEAITALLHRGYTSGNVEEKLAQDIVLLALSKSGHRDQVTIKGGVVMANLTKDTRRATMDLDIDFVRFSLSDEAIDGLIADMDKAIDGVEIIRVGDILELKQQDYSGKRVYLELHDSLGGVLQCKLDIGVHTLATAEQADMDFEVAGGANANLRANGKEQIFVEKLRSLLRLGPISNRGKDVFDMSYLADKVDKRKLKALIADYIYGDARMLESSTADILRRLRRIFADPLYMRRLSGRKMNWLGEDPAVATGKLVAFIESL